MTVHGAPLLSTDHFLQLAGDIWTASARGHE